MGRDSRRSTVDQKAGAYPYGGCDHPAPVDGLTVYCTRNVRHDGQHFGWLHGDGVWFEG